MSEEVFPQQRPESGNGDFNQIAFMVKQIMSGISTSTLVQVKAVYPGGTGPVGFVDVQPMVGAVDGGGKVWPHGIIYGVPYIRIQGGVNAFIVDPVEGDIGLAVFADHDLSAAEAAGQLSGPGSARRFDMADALFVNGWNMKTTPQNYVIINPDGSIAIMSTGRIDVTGTVTEFHCPVIIDKTLDVKGDTTMEGNATVEKNATVAQNLGYGGGLTGSNSAGTGGGATINGPVQVTGTVNTSSSIAAAGNVTAGGISLNSHIHSDPQGGVTGGPQ